MDNYINNKINFTKEFSEEKHLKRMTHENQIAAIELHKEVQWK